MTEHLHGGERAMSKGLGALQRSVLEAHRQWWESKHTTGEYVPAWDSYQARTIARIVYGGEPTESQMRSMRRAVKRLIEDGHMTKAVRVTHKDRETAEREAKRAHVLKIMGELSAERPGCMFTSGMIGARCRKDNPELWGYGPRRDEDVPEAVRNLRGLFGNASPAQRVVGILRGLSDDGETIRVQGQRGGVGWTYYHLP